MRKKVMLVCVSGISTGLIVHNLQEIANEKSVPIDFFSSSVVEAVDSAKKYDISAILIGPQVKGKIESVIEFSRDASIPVDYISDEDFTTLNADEILNQTTQLVK